MINTESVCLTYVRHIYRALPCFVLLVNIALWLTWEICRRDYPYNFNPSVSRQYFCLLYGRQYNL